MQFNKVDRLIAVRLAPIELHDTRYGGLKQWTSTNGSRSSSNPIPVLLYMKGTPDFPQCGFSAKTVSVLRAHGAKFAYINIFEDPEVREGLKAYSNWPTFPQLYVNGELIGGCDIAVELYQSGELKQILDAAAAPQTAQ